MPRKATLLTLAATALMIGLVPTSPLAAQGLKIAVGDVGIGLGPVPRIDGLRINFRDDRRLERVRGINATIWSPYEDLRGDVYGLALGLPLTGARDLTGLGIGGGVAVFRDFRGVAVSALGMGAGSDISGVVLGGLGAGAGNSITGLAVGGLGVGVGNDARGLLFGGLGAGAGNSISGLAVGGLGVGAGNNFSGIGLGGLGIGAGNSITGIAASLGGVGAGNDISGVAIAGLGIGAGNHLRWLAVAGLGIGASEITGLAAAAGVGGVDIHGLVIAPVYMRVVEEGRLTGVSVSAYNDIRGAQHGLAIGLINIAEELHGLQVGLINIARNKDTLPILPLVNWSR